MNKDTFLKFIAAFIKDFLNNQDIKIDMNTKFESIPDWSSMVLVASMASIQSEFGVVPDLDDLYAAKSINELYEAFR